MVDLAPRSSLPPSSTGGDLWRFTATSRMPANEPQGDLSDARSRKLAFKLRDTAQLTLAISGRSPQLGWLEELRSDVIAYRWSDAAGAFVPRFRGCITQSEDEISPTIHTVTLTATGYRGVLDRRSLRAGLTFAATEQATIIGQLFTLGDKPFGYSGALGLAQAFMNPDGSPLAGNATGVNRDRTYYPGQVIGAAIDNMSTDLPGPFDWGVEPSTDHAGVASLWYPQRGTTRPFVAEYGATVSDVTRAVSTTAFANYSMVTGATPEGATSALFAEAFGDGWNDPVAYPEGAWMAVTGQPDVSVVATLQQSANGNVALYGDLEPSYTLKMVAGRWSPDDCWLGDTVRLIVQSGRLNVDTSVRITAVAIDIDETGTEAATLTAGIPPPGLGPLLRSVDRRLDRLEIR